jgi:hypothetical protein
MKELVEETLVKKMMDRRSLLRGAAGAGVGLLAGGLLAGCGGSEGGINVTPGQNNNGSGGNGGGGGGAANLDQQVLNFALNLEYLEAEFYLRATGGQGLSASEAGTSQNNVTGGRPVTFTSSVVADLAQELATDERAHVLFLRQALGGAAVARPALNFTTSFQAAAQAAGLGNDFDAFRDETSFLLASFVFEDVGVTAYKGAAPLLTNKGVLEAAAGILGVEAYHSGAIRTILAMRGGAAADAANRISDARDSLDGAGDKDQGIEINGRTNFVPTDGNGIAFSRSTAEVLRIVYLGAAPSANSFFPSGLNGSIR